LASIAARLGELWLTQASGPALVQPTVTRALKTLNRGGIVVRDRHIDGEQIVFVELTATARGAEECLPTAAGSAFPG
jgi:hypothetical protein